MYAQLRIRQRWLGFGGVLLLFVAAGCPGSVDPSLIPSGSGGTHGGGAGTTGAGGSSVQSCDTAPIYMAKACANAGCHDANGTSAAFDMTSPGWQTHLVGVNPKGGGTLASACAANGPYLVPGMIPAKGLFLDKLKEGTACGVVMPFAGTVLTATELDCVQTWANALVASGGTAALDDQADGEGGAP